jgi:hypothetical protein
MTSQLAKDILDRTTQTGQLGQVSLDMTMYGKCTFHKIPDFCKKICENVFQNENSLTFFAKMFGIPTKAVYKNKTLC